MADNTTYNDLVGFTTGTATGIVSNPRNIGDVMNNLSIRVMAETKKQLNEKVTGETSNALESSIQMPIKIFGASYVATLSMLSYYDYINQGVKGVGGQKNKYETVTSKNGNRYRRPVKDGAGNIVKETWEVISTNSPYKYSTLKPPLKGLKYWSQSRGLNPFAVQESIFRKGLRANHFWDDAYKEISTGKIFKQLEDDLRTAGVNATTEGIKKLFKKL